MATDLSSHGISAAELNATLGTDRHPLVIDVRRAHAFQASPRLIAGSAYRAPEEVEGWQAALPRDTRIVVTCAHGHEVGQNAAAALRTYGLDARYLIDGVEGWLEARRPSQGKSTVYDGTKPTRWVTRARPKIDRIACPWLIKRFVDPFAEFHYVPAQDVEAMSEKLHAIPFDIPGVDFSHHDEGCSFDAMIERFDLTDPTLDRLATIVRGADTSRLDLAPQSAGLYAISLGLSDLYQDDHAMLAAGMTIYDALYRWQRNLTGETHAWPPRATGAA